MRFFSDNERACSWLFRQPSPESGNSPLQRAFIKGEDLLYKQSIDTIEN